MSRDIHVSAQVEQDLDAAIDRLTRGAERLGPSARQAEPPPPLAVKRILVALDGTSASAHVLAWAREFARPFGAKVLAIHAAPPREARQYAFDYMLAMGWVPPPEDIAPEVGENTARAFLDDAVDELGRAGVDAESEVHFGPAAHTIVAVAERFHADVVILGAHDRGRLGRALLGSVADGVTDHVRGHVLIARTAPPAQRLLIAADGSRASKRAAALGLRLSHAWQAPAHVVYVFDPMLAPGATTRDIAAERGQAFGKLESTWTQPKATFEVAVGNPAERILHLADELGSDLVVLGARGIGGLASLVMGSVARRIAHDAPQSVLIVKEAQP